MDLENALKLLGPPDQRSTNDYYSSSEHSDYKQICKGKATTFLAYKLAGDDAMSVSLELEFDKSGRLLRYSTVAN